MIRKNFLVAFRYLRRNRLFSLINIVGLSIGIACFSLIIMHVIDEFSYDRFIPHSDRIYRLALERVYPDNRVYYAVVPESFKDVLETDFPEVEQAVRIVRVNAEIAVMYEDVTFIETGLAFCDTTLFDFFSIKMLEGDASSALSSPTSLVMTRSTARRYFGESDVVGKMIRTQFGEFMVTGVCEDIPHNSHMEFDILVSNINMGFNQRNNYTAFSTHIYVKLREGTRAAEVEKKFPDMVTRYAAGQIEQNMGIPYREYVAAGNGYRYFLQPVRQIHLHSNLQNEMKQNGSALYTFVSILIALFILLLAGVNFVNLSTALSTDRAREVGIRKTSGAGNRQLRWQFMSESVLISLLSMSLSILIIELVLPAFNNLTGKDLKLDYFGNPLTLPSLLVFAVLIGLLAGSYPSFVLSRFQPSLVIKGKFSRSRLGIVLRNSLVVFQFIISIVLITVTLLVNRQMNFIRQRDLGFTKENVILLERLGFMGEKLDPFKQEIQKITEVQSAAFSNFPVSGGFYFGVMFQVGNRNTEIKTTRGMVVDEDFIRTMQMELVSGRSFSTEFNDSLSVILNESAVKEFGLSNPIGARLIETETLTGESWEFTVVGVVKDFHFNSLHEEIISFVMFSTTGPHMNLNTMSVRIKPGSQQGAIAHIEEVWRRFNPDQPFTYKFLSSELQKQYRNEEKSGSLISLFTLLAIIIACIGLFGLAVFASRTRIREIGIRKVLGSDVASIIILLLKDFARLVFIAYLLSLPLSYLFMNEWLRNFTYRTNIGLLIYLLPGFIALFIAMLTISIQAWRTALTHPVNALKFE